MREEVRALVALGPFPNEDAEVDQVDRWGQALHKIVPPVTNEEARALSTLFGEDEGYGAAWTLLHLIETAPNWPLEDCLQADGNEWIQRLRRRTRSKQP